MFYYDILTISWLFSLVFLFSASCCFNGAGRRPCLASTSWRSEFIYVFPMGREIVIASATISRCRDALTHTHTSKTLQFTHTHQSPIRTSFAYLFITILYNFISCWRDSSFSVWTTPKQTQTLLCIARGNSGALCWCECVTVCVLVRWSCSSSLHVIRLFSIPTMPWHLHAV